MDNTIRPAIYDSLGHLISTRHSTRNFLPKSVSIDDLKRSLIMAQNAPSGSNTQPWRAIFLSGNALTSLKTALIEAADSDPSRILQLPEAFRHYRSSLGRKLYGQAMGIARDDLPARKAAVLRNFEFFGAPMAGIIYIDKTMYDVDLLSVGMWLQTLVLELTSLGLDTCIEVSVAGYHQIIKKELNISDDMEILCGLAVGYGDPTSAVNQVVAGRDDWEQWIEIRQ
ncbi:Nitroreductase [Aspergillus alliaceus]|uniref:Nitroreductase n=1 Tax=Petromyces alliaceus TaxID=209559 RepID=A0A5N7CHX4_PETAA|nr:Nitroreductase [Aspergillus alliaceus]KAB8231177.1 Nitroreductase [Aspergillus alliaceus]KAE8393764.1 Nitroreductase [Aspergillus alliaceus]